MDLSPFTWLSKSLWFGGSQQEARPYYLTDRVLACVYGAGTGLLGSTPLTRHWDGGMHATPRPFLRPTAQKKTGMPGTRPRTAPTCPKGGCRWGGGCAVARTHGHWGPPLSCNACLVLRRGARPPPPTHPRTRYKAYLRDLSDKLKAIRDRAGEPPAAGSGAPAPKDHAGIQFVNLSPAWRDPDVYSYFNNSGGWEGRGGRGEGSGEVRRGRGLGRGAGRCKGGGLGDAAWACGRPWFRRHGM